jgi:tRNA (guanine37-N1)-methyltransferase
VRVDLFSIFPEYLDGPLRASLLGRAREAGILDLRVHDPREHTTDRHRSVDDAPFGGGAGMVMRPEPLFAAVEPLRAAGAHVILMDPAGERLGDPLARELATLPHIALICGRYEGIDERVLEDAADRFEVRPVSIGDYVLNGGEVAVLAIVEAVGRLLPGVVGNAESLVEESHEDGLLEYPVYTKPARWRERDVPAVLLSGHHAQVSRWRRDQRLRRTARRRPDLLGTLDPADFDRADLLVLADEGWQPDGPRFRRVAATVAD